MVELDEALVGRVAAALAQNEWERPVWHEMEPHDQAVYRQDARAALRLLASEGLLCEPDSDVALLGEEIVHLREDLDNALEALEGLLSAVEAHNEANSRTMVDPHETERARAALPKPTG